MWMHLPCVRCRGNCLMNSESSAIFQTETALKGFWNRKNKDFDGLQGHGAAGHVSTLPTTSQSVCSCSDVAWRAQTSTCSTRSTARLKRFLTLQKTKPKKTLTDVPCAGLNTGPATLMWPDASVTLLLNGISGYCCRKTWQLPHYDELKVSSERETSQLRPFISVLTTSMETKEKRWKMCLYLWLVQEEAGQSGFVASEVE